DLYLDDTGSGGYYPEDDDDFNSGSGSGGGEEAEEAVTISTVYIKSNAAEPTQDSTKVFTPRVETATHRDRARESMPRKPIRTELKEVRSARASHQGKTWTDIDTEVHTENLFQRTEVLAAVIAGGVIGFLFAIFLILLLVYRMRKKDEGSYDLGERKPSGAAYQKAPTKEFYA
uniref:Syndecan n=1 Tax=Tetraodon nigroviridis TaxID=99883 RepID=H3DK48_TETNG